MTQERTDVRGIGTRLTSMISQRYYTDAAFERVCELPPKTVSNWRRGRSASYMKMLPRLAETLGVDVRALLSDETEEDPPLTREETVLLDAFRQARALPASARGALLQTLLTMIRLSCGGAQ